MRERKRKRVRERGREREREREREERGRGGGANREHNTQIKVYSLVAPIASPLHVAPRVENPEEVGCAPDGGHLGYQGNGVGVASDEAAATVMLVVLKVVKNIFCGGYYCFLFVGGFTY